jgi:hypothetical protein
MLYRTLLFLIFMTLFSCAAVVRAQSPRDPFEREKMSPIELEMHARRIIKAAEKDHQDNLERAREAGQLGTELRDAYSQNRSLSRADLKKLERLEKLTRKIRSAAGGDDDDDSKLENAPLQLEPAVARLAELSEAMQKGVEKTPRQVVSAFVIERANELLDIISYIRTLSH